MTVRRDTGRRPPCRCPTRRGASPDLSAKSRPSCSRPPACVATPDVAVDTYDAFRSASTRLGGFLVAHWCGDTACEDRVNDETKATIRCLPREPQAPDTPCIVCGAAGNRTRHVGPGVLTRGDRASRARQAVPRAPPLPCVPLPIAALARRVCGVSRAP